MNFVLLYTLSWIWFPAEDLATCLRLLYIKSLKIIFKNHNGNEVYLTTSLIPSHAREGISETVLLLFMYPSHSPYKFLEGRCLCSPCSLCHKLWEKILSKYILTKQVDELRKLMKEKLCITWLLSNGLECAYLSALSLDYRGKAGWFGLVALLFQMRW